jgi:DNA-binding MarR family transcriptional regulator
MKAAARAHAREPDTASIGRAPPGIARDAKGIDGSGRHETLGVGLWVRLLESHNLMLGQVRRRLAGECTMPRFDLLANLEREDGQTLAALSRRMLVTAGNLTGLVDRAERDGVVERRSDPGDRRLSRVYLTSKGRELVQSLLPKHAHDVTDLLSTLDPGERRELRRLLGKLRDSLLGRREAP